MSKVTVREAAFLTGKSRETINTACNDGLLSSSLNERKVKVIDISELERVYPLVKTMAEMGQSEPVKESQGLTETGPSDLRALAKAQEQGSKAMLMLTDQSESGGKRVLEQEQKVRELSDTVIKLQQQNKRIYRELKAQQSRGFWKWLIGETQPAQKQKITLNPDSPHPVASSNIQAL